MGLPGYWFRTTLPRRWRGYLGVVLLLGITGGLSLFALAGARRTQSSYPRFARAVHASTMAVDTGPYDPALLARIGHFPQVERAQTYVAFAVTRLVNNKPDFAQDFESLASLDGRFFDQDRFTPTTGRLPGRHRADEVAVNETAARLYGYHVGQKLDLGTYDLSKASRDDPGVPVLRMQATVTAVGLFPNEVLQDDTDRSPLVLFTPAYTKHALPYAQYQWQGLTLKRGDADVEAVKREWAALLDPGFPQFFRVTSVTTFHVEQAVRPLSIALALFGAIATLACVVLVGQTLGRLLRGEPEERLALGAMGATRSLSTRAAAVGPTLAVVVGGALAAAFAIAASPLMPIGKVRRVEVTPGFDADWTVLGFGALLLVAMLVTFIWVTGWRVAPHRPRLEAPARASRLVGAAQGAGLSPAAVAGIRLAVEPGHGRTAVPVRSVIAGVAMAMTALTAAVTFGGSLATLVHTPRLYGWSWDATLLDQGGYGAGHVEIAQRVFGGDPNIEAFAGSYFGSDEVDGHNVALLGVRPGATVHPPILEGRSIKSKSETVLGSETLAALGKHVGDRVALGNETPPRQLRIVGTATLPTIGIIHGAYTSLGVGALVEQTLVPGYDRSQSTFGYSGPNVWFVKFRGGIDHRAAVAKLRREMGPVGSESGSLVYTSAQRPAEIVNAADIGSAPTMLATVLAVAAFGSLGLALAASVRRRRRDLALLKTLGFTGRQVGATVRWQAALTVLTGLVVGVPLGIVAGRTLWVLFADQLEVVPHSATPFLAIAAISMVALLVGMLAAAIPARVARRVQPAIALRSE
jgi:hypothetical protein